MKTWGLVLPPSRPSHIELRRIRSQVAGLDRSLPVAVLGNTPEYRDLLFESGFKEIYVLEKHLDFLSAVSNYRIYNNPERIIEGDWLVTLPDLKSHFALILSDLTSGNIDYAHRRRFYDLVSGALLPGGLFSDKVLTHSGPNIMLSQLADEYSELPLNLLYVNRFSCEALFCSELLDLEDRVNSSLFYSVLNERLTNDRLRAFVKHAQDITPPGFIWWYGRKWKDLSGDYCRRLKTIAVQEDEPSSPYFGRLKVFLHSRT